MDDTNEVAFEQTTESLANDLFPERGAAPTDAPEADDTDGAVDASTETLDEAPEEKPTRAAPNSWKAEMREKFAALSPDVQDYIESREKQMSAGLEKDRSDANMGRTMRDIMTPYQSMLKAQGVDEPKAVQTLLNAHYKLSNGSATEKSAYFAQLAKSYGIEQNAAPQAQENIDPAIRALQEELSGIRQNLSSSHQRAFDETKARMARDVEAFASAPEHPHFDDVAEDIVKMLSAGYDLDTAYEKAVWANPTTRAKEMNRLQTESRQKAKQEADTARKAKSVNVTTRDTSSTSTGSTATMKNLDGALRESMREMKSKSH